MTCPVPALGGKQRDTAAEQSPEEDTEEDEIDWDNDAMDRQGQGRSPSKTASKSKVSPSPMKARDAKGLNTTSPAAKQSGKKPEAEFDFLDEINSSSRLSGSSLASIKQFFGHKATAAPASAASTAHGAAAKKYASGKHSSARDPSPIRPRANSDGSDSEDGYGPGYGRGAEYTTEEEEEEGGENEGETGEQEEAAGLEEHWNLATYLPEAAAQYFHFVTGKMLFIRGGQAQILWLPSLRLYHAYELTDCIFDRLLGGLFSHVVYCVNTTAAEFLQQYKNKREQLQLIRQHTLHQSDSGLFGASLADGASADGAASEVRACKVVAATLCF
jgi:hypothetical protein